MDKQSLRRHIRALKQAQTPEQLAEWSDALALRLESHPWFRVAQSVLLFTALPDEPETRTLLTRHAQEKRIFLPAVIGDELEIRRYRSPKDLQKGAFGIEEPVGEALSDLSELELVLVPGVAFDREGHRLGRGRGYYDRLFAHQELRAYRLGYAFPFQILPRVPFEAHDVKMDDILLLNDL